MKRSVPLEFEPRSMCARCARPVRVCYCAHLTSIDTRTRVVLLQHPRERGVAIGTARIAQLCLSSSELHVGVDFESSPALRRALADPERPPVLLYPGDDAVDVLAHPPSGPVTLVVVDGTWSQAKKLVRSNPTLAQLPRYAFRAPAPSEYRIRAEPDESYVSTLEALVHVLGVLEGHPERFRALLVPFRAMIDAQIAFTGAEGHARARAKKRPPRAKALRTFAALAPGRAGIVCVTGEANAWPFGSHERASHPDELVHWVACRPATGEMLDVVVRPRHALAPSTSRHIGLSDDTLLQGGTVPELVRAWRGFARDDDVVCSWGPYALGVFASATGELPKARIDLRGAARLVVGGRVGAMTAVLEKLAVDPTSIAPIARGRAGVRAAQLHRLALMLGERVGARLA